MTQRFSTAMDGMDCPSFLGNDLLSDRLSEIFVPLLVYSEGRGPCAPADYFGLAINLEGILITM